MRLPQPTARAALADTHALHIFRLFYTSGTARTALDTQVGRRESARATPAATSGSASTEAGPDRLRPHVR